MYINTHKTVGSLSPQMDNFRESIFPPSFLLTGGATSTEFCFSGLKRSQAAIRSSPLVRSLSKTACQCAATHIFVSVHERYYPTPFHPTRNHKDSPTNFRQKTHQRPFRPSKPS